MSKVASSYYGITSFIIDNNKNNPQKITGFKVNDLVDKMPEIIFRGHKLRWFFGVKIRNQLS